MVGECLHELDVIIYATGFHSVTGELLRIDIRGLDNVSLERIQTFEKEIQLGLKNDSAGQKIYQTLMETKALPKEADLKAFKSKRSIFAKKNINYNLILSKINTHGIKIMN